MLNKILISCAIFLLTISVKADELVINPDYPENYTVVKGDTLWGISARFLKQPWRWPEIWNVNPQIADPHLIYPGDVVSLSYKDGQPTLNVARGTDQAVSDRYVKLSPTILSFENDKTIPSIPIDAIQQFLDRSLVLSEDEMDDWPYVVSSYDEHLIATTGNKIYIRGLPEKAKGARYSIYRKGAAYRKPAKSDAEKGEILGYEAIYVGDAVLEKQGDPASAIITLVEREVLTGDRLLAQSDEDMSGQFIPEPTASEVEGNIISVIGGVSQVGQHQIVVLSLGKQQGLKPGNVLGIYQNSYVVQDGIGPNTQNSEKKKAANKAEIFANGTLPEKLVYELGEIVDKFDETFPTIANKQAKHEGVTLPKEYVGIVMVFRAFDKVSYALVMETQGPVHVLDIVKSI